MCGRWEIALRHVQTIHVSNSRTGALHCDRVDSKLDLQLANRLVGLVVKASAPRAADPGFDSRLRSGDFCGSSHTSDLKIGAPVASLSGAWRYRVSAGTGWPVVSILWVS